MTPLSYLSVLKVSGTDAAKFLQSQLTAQLQGLQAPAATFSAYCSPKGQVIAILLLSPRQDHWWVVVESSLLQILVARLQKYILRADVRLEPQPDLQVLAMDPDESAADDGSVFEVVLGNGKLPIRYALSAVPSREDTAALTHWRREELLLGIAWLDAASSEKYIPQMLGLEAIGAVSFSKGCYPGQEVIARAKHLGQVKRRPLVLDIAGPQAPDVRKPCLILTSEGQVEATLVQCVAASATAFTLFAVAALPPGEVIRAVEQAGVSWSAKPAVREPYP